MQYETDENFSLLIRHIPALAFLHSDDIPNVFDELRVNIPAETNDIIKWFEIHYIRNKIRCITKSGNIIRSELIFPSSL